MTRPRLKEVAELAGVSEPTVSRVLNGRTGVAATTRERVVAALNQLGFEAVPPPQRPRHQRIGVISGELTNPVFATFAHHLSANLARRDQLAVMTVCDAGTNDEARCLTDLVEAGVDAIVCIGGSHAEQGGDLSRYRDLIGSGMPLVLVNGAATSLPVPHVRCDEGVGAHQAVSHLAELGHRRLGLLVGPRRYVPTHRMIESFHQAMATIGTRQGELVETAFTIEGGRAGAARLLAEGVSGIVAANDLMALGAIQAAQATGRAVPEAVSVIGYDGTDLTGTTNPPLTTLRQPFEDMTQLVTEAVLGEVEGNENFRDHYVFEPQLLVRRSTSRPGSLPLLPARPREGATPQPGPSVIG